MQAMTLRPRLRACAHFSPTSWLLSFSKLRLSECPRITHSTPRSLSWSAEICARGCQPQLAGAHVHAVRGTLVHTSPVYAPVPSTQQFWAAIS